MTTVKILYYYSSAQIDTGSPRAMLRMIDSLDRTQFQPAFMASGEGSLIDELRSRDVEIIDGEGTSVSWKHPGRLGTLLRDKRRLLRSFGVDVLHMNEPGWNTDIVLAAGLAKVPVALHLHNPGTIALQNLNYVVARKVFLCSGAQSAQIVNFGRIKDKSIVLHNGVDIEAFAKGRPIRAALGLAADDLVIGTVAQISHRKGIDLFLDTAERLLASGRPFKFVIAGPEAIGEEAYFRSFVDRIGQERMRKDVIYLGSRSDIPDILASFDVFFLPTRAEPFGMVIIEAMAAGVPVVASRVGGIPEIVTSPDIGRTVDELNPRAYAEAIVELVQLGDDLKALGERGRRSLYGRFDLASMGTRLGSVYKQLAMSRFRV